MKTPKYRTQATIDEKSSSNCVLCAKSDECWSDCTENNNKDVDENSCTTDYEDYYDDHIAYYDDQWLSNKPILQKLFSDGTDINIQMFLLFSSGNILPEGGVVEKASGGLTSTSLIKNSC